MNLVCNTVPKVIHMNLQTIVALYFQVDLYPFRASLYVRDIVTKLGCSINATNSIKTKLNAELYKTQISTKDPI